MRAACGRAALRTDRVWLFDLDDTLHDASTASMPGLHVSFGEYIQQHLQLTQEESDALRRRYWQRYGATLLGLVKHHGVDAAHFLHHTHLLPGLEAAVRGHAHDFAALRRLRGRKFILTNAPRAYAERVLARARHRPLLRRPDQHRGHAHVRRAAAQARRAHAAHAAGAAARAGRRAACWWKTRCSTRSRRAASA